MTEPKDDGLADLARVVLAHERPFRLGTLSVSPSTRQVTNPVGAETVEPRVMRALVALARAGGAIVTRDELIERCWDGRIVSDDAINRVLSRIRHIASGIGDGSFTIETIARVGYRVVTVRGAGAGPPPEPTADPALTREGRSRRALLVGAGATVLAVGVAGLIWRQPWRHHPNAEAEQLVRRGNILSREGLPGQIRQSLGYFERAVALDPEYADAWGALALCYSHLLEGYDRAELVSLPGRIRSAADRALALDPGNADGQLALIFMTPFFRNWAAKEVELRRIVEQHPRHWLAQARLGVLLYQVGRLEEGMRHHRLALEAEPMLPVSYAYLIRNLSALGRAQDVDAVIRQARERWPAHPSIWVATFNHWLYSGRPGAAAAMTVDSESIPVTYQPEEVQRLLRLARALETRGPADVSVAVEDLQRVAATDTSAIPSAAAAFAALGRSDLTYAGLDRYYFDRGSFGTPTPIGPYTRRSTDTLFTAPMAGLRAEPRFRALTQELGLEAYWRDTRTAPDYRRG